MSDWSSQHLDKRRSQLSNLVRGIVVPELVEGVPDGERRDVTLIWDPDPSTKLKLEVRTSHHVQRLAVDYSPDFLQKLRDDPSTITEDDFCAWWIRPKTPAELEYDRLAAAAMGYHDFSTKDAAVVLAQITEMIQGAPDRRAPRLVEGDVTMFVQPEFPYAVKIEIRDRAKARTTHLHVTATGWRRPYANGRWTLPPKGSRAFGFFFVVLS